MVHEHSHNTSLATPTHRSLRSDRCRSGCYRDPAGHRAPRSPRQRAGYGRPAPHPQTAAEWSGPSYNLHSHLKKNAYMSWCAPELDHRNPRDVLMPVLSSLAAPMPPVTAKFDSWQLSVFRDWNGFDALHHGLFHDDVIKWRHFPRYWPFVRGMWRGTFMFSLICAWINRWVNNREAGDLRRYRAYYDVIVMCRVKLKSRSQNEDMKRFENTRFYDWSWNYRCIEEN